MADPRDFLLNTDYEMDKIIYVKEGKADPPASGSTSTRIELPNPFSFRPLLFGLCSFNEDFSSPKPSPYYQDPKVIHVGGPVGISISYDITFSASIEEDQIFILYRNVSSNPRPIYYRIYGFAPSDVNIKLPPTKNYAKTFTLNTDRDYRKLYKQGIVNLGQSVTIDHNFGYIPQAMLWQEAPYFGLCSLLGSSSEEESTKMVITNDKVRITTPPASSAETMQGYRLHYRIYCDEA